MNLIHLLRLSKMARRKQPMWKVKLVFGVIAVCLLILGLEWMGWWPDWAKVEPMRRRF